MNDFSKASVQELLGMAARAEIEANKTYSRMANNVSNPLLKEKFQMLAFEENKHRHILEKLHKVLFRGSTMQIPDKTNEALLPSIYMTPSSPLVDILYQAMQSERSAENFYADLAKKVEDKQKKILEYMSRVERTHYMMLKSEYTLAQGFEDYAEKDIDKIVT